MLDRELCHSTSKPIGDEEDKLKSFMSFDITSHRPVFRVVLGSQIVVPSTIPRSQWHPCDLNPWPWLWYHLLDCELCHSTSKPIGDEKVTLKSFMSFDITPSGSIFRVVVGSQTVVPQYNILMQIIVDLKHTYVFYSSSFLSKLCQVVHKD